MSEVFLHPVGLDRECWTLTSSRLNGAVRYNMLWHGGREEPSEPLTLEAMADDLVAHVEGPLDIVGVSMGGAVAQLTALRHPERVRSLMVCASGFGRPGVSQEHEERAETVLRVGIDGILEPMLERWFTKDALSESGNSGVAYTRARLLADSPQQFAAGWRALSVFDVKERLGNIAVPTTVLHPSEDLSPLSAKEEMVNRLPLGRLATLEGPHMIHLEHREEFEGAVLEHLEWVDSLDK